MLPPITIRSDGPLPHAEHDAYSVDKIALWAKLFAEHHADPLAIIGVKPDGTPVVTAVETIRGKPFKLRELLEDILSKVGDR